MAFSGFRRGVLALVTVVALGAVAIRAIGPDPVARARQAFAGAPLGFVEGRGQIDPRVAYSTQSPVEGVYFTPDGLAVRPALGGMGNR